MAENVIKTYSCEAICKIEGKEKHVKEISKFEHGPTYFMCGLGQNNCSVLNAYNIDERVNRMIDVSNSL